MIYLLYFRYRSGNQVLSKTGQQLHLSRVDVDIGEDEVNHRDGEHRARDRDAVHQRVRDLKIFVVFTNKKSAMI